MHFRFDFCYNFSRLNKTFESLFWRHQNESMIFACRPCSSGSLLTLKVDYSPDPLCLAIFINFFDTGFRFIGKTAAPSTYEHVKRPIFNWEIRSRPSILVHVEVQNGFCFTRWFWSEMPIFCSKGWHDTTARFFSRSTPYWDSLPWRLTFELKSNSKRGCLCLFLDKVSFN